ncbi:MAG: CPBP family intramembrane metalloprotease [Dorea sp.]|nr:CPBP family intramembrane metalloprotease [Dorea sp.]
MMDLHTDFDNQKAWDDDQSLHDQMELESQLGSETCEDAADVEACSEAPVKKEKQLKLWHGILLLVFVAADIIFLGSFVSMVLGIRGFYATAMGEILMLLGALAVTLLAGARLKPVFQFRKPEWKKSFGTVLLWVGCFFLTILVTTIMEYFFPTEMAGVSEGLEQGILSVSMLPALLIVSLSPAICEEMVFRGVLFNCIWNKTHRKWVTIILVGMIFGIFHGSIWRFVPTCILGIMMGYILFETNNMFYNMLFHGINNACPILLMFASGLTSDGVGSQMDAVLNDPEAYRMTLLPAIGFYMILGAMGLILLYLGRNMICHVDLTVPGEIRLAKKTKERNRMVILACALGILGLLVIFVGAWLGGGVLAEGTSVVFG